MCLSETRRLLGGGDVEMMSAAEIASSGGTTTTAAPAPGAWSFCGRDNLAMCIGVLAGAGLALVLLIVIALVIRRRRRHPMIKLDEFVGFYGNAAGGRGAASPSAVPGGADALYDPSTTRGMTTAFHANFLQDGDEEIELGEMDLYALDDAIDSIHNQGVAHAAVTL